MFYTMLRLTKPYTLFHQQAIVNICLKKHIVGSLVLIFGVPIKVHGQLSKHYWWPRMRADISGWCQGCLVCATRQPGKAVKPPLTPIPVEGPFHHVGVNIIQFVKSHSGNQYAIVFTDYLTKWPKVFATKDQTALTIARLFVEEIVCRYAIPSQLLSDRGLHFSLI